MNDLVIFAVYAIACRYSKHAIIPATAFLITACMAFIDIQTIYSHVIFACVYLLLIPFCSVKIGYGMFASSVVNALTIGYFLSPLRIEYFVLIFTISMVVINSYILFTVFKGLKNGKPSGVGDATFYRYLDLSHIQASTKAGARR